MQDISQNTTLDSVLLSENAAHYGDDYRSHYLTQYRDFVSSADTISSRRHTANQFFLGINTALIGAGGYIKVDDPVIVLVLAGFGVTICLAWRGLIDSYRTLNGAKFDVIQSMEKHLPLASFTAEELAYSSARAKHRSFSSWESWVPRLYIFAHLTLGAAGLWRHFYS